MKLKKVISIVLFLFLTLNLVSCAPGDTTIVEPGFFTGVWHGLLFLYTFIANLFGSSYDFFAETNSGFFYYLGWGIGMVFSIIVELFSLLILFFSLSSRN